MFVAPLGMRTAFGRRKTAEPSVVEAREPLLFRALDPVGFARLLFTEVHYSYAFGMLSVTVASGESFSTPCRETSDSAIVDMTQRALSAMGWRKLEAKLVRRCRHTLILAKSLQQAAAAAPPHAGNRALQALSTDIVSYGGCSVDVFRDALALVCNVSAASVRTESRQVAGLWQTDVWLDDKLVRTADLQCESRVLSQRTALLLATDQALDGTRSAIDSQ